MLPSDAPPLRDPEALLEAPPDAPQTPLERVAFTLDLFRWTLGSGRGQVLLQRIEQEPRAIGWLRDIAFKAQALDPVAAARWDHIALSVGDQIIWSTQRLYQLFHPELRPWLLQVLACWPESLPVEVNVGPPLGTRTPPSHSGVRFPSATLSYPSEVTETERTDGVQIALERAGASLAEQDACLRAMQDQGFTAAARWLALPDPLPTLYSPFARAVGLPYMTAMGVVIQREPPGRAELRVVEAVDLQSLRAATRMDPDLIHIPPQGLDAIGDEQVEQLLYMGLTVWMEGLSGARAERWAAHQAQVYADNPPEAL
ncbi:MAG: hypothetical protein VX899_03735 [Myxococcota bacterium]|nr:hypothetical protein [Myxococcota bacterium]